MTTTMSATIKPLPHRHGSSTSSSPSRHGTPGKRQHEYTVPIKPPSEAGSVSKQSGTSRSVGWSSRDSSSRQPREGVLLRVGKRSVNNSASSSTGSSGLTGGSGAAGSGRGMSGDLLEVGGLVGTSVDTLERRFQKFIKDDSPTVGSIAGMAAVLGGDDLVVVEGGGGGGGGGEESVNHDTSTVAESREEKVFDPLKKVPIQEKQKQPAQQKKETAAVDQPHDEIRNPFGRPLPREHVYSARKTDTAPPSPAAMHTLVVKPVGAAGVAATNVTAAQPDQQERAERYTTVTASTVPTTTVSSEGGWLDRHLKALGGKKPAGKDVHVFQIEEGREMTTDEIKSMQKTAKKNGVSTAAALILQEQQDVTGTADSDDSPFREQFLEAEKVEGHAATSAVACAAAADDATAAAHTTAEDTIGTIGEETAGELLVGFTHQLQSMAIAGATGAQQSKPWERPEKDHKAKKMGTRSPKAEAEKSQNKRDRRLERAAERRTDKDAAKARRKEEERHRKRLEHFEAARRRKKSRVAEAAAGAEGARSVSSAYTSSAEGDATGTAYSQSSGALLAKASYQQVRSMHASRNVIGNLEVLDRDAMALERDIWAGIDEMMKDAFTTMSDDQTSSDGSAYESTGIDDNGTSCYSRYSARSHMTTRSRAWDTVSKLGDKVKDDIHGSSSSDEGEIELAKTALQGFISFFAEQDKVEVAGESSSEILHDSLGNLTNYTREKATRDLPRHSGKNIIQNDGKQTTRQSKQQSVLEGLLELSSRNLATESTQSLAVSDAAVKQAAREVESDTEAQSLGSIDDIALGQVALDAFADVLIESSSQLGPSQQAVSSDKPRPASVAKDIDVSPEKKALLHGDQLTLFEVFRWSLRVNIDAKIREAGKEERCLLKLHAQEHRKRKKSRTKSKRKQVIATPAIPEDKEYEDDATSELNEEEIQRQLALAMQGVGDLIDEEETKGDDSPPVEDISSEGSDDDDVVDEAVARRKELWKKGMKLEQKRSERAASLLNAAANLGLLSSTEIGEVDDENKFEESRASIGVADLEYAHPAQNPLAKKGEEHHMSGSSSGSAATHVVGNTRNERIKPTSTLSLVREESEGRSSADSSRMSNGRPFQSHDSDASLTPNTQSQTNIADFLFPPKGDDGTDTDSFDERQGTAAAYASLERWESDEDGDSSVQEDAASAAFALISSAAVPGARMPKARPASLQSMSASEASEQMAVSSSTGTSASSIFGFSRTGSGRSRASTRSALASSHQSSGLDSIPEKDILMQTPAANQQRRGSLASSVPDDDSSSKVLEDLRKIRERYGLDDDEEVAEPISESYDAGVPHHDLQTIEERKSSSSGGSSRSSPKSAATWKDDGSIVVEDSPAKLMDSLRDISERFGLDLVDDARSCSDKRSSGESGRNSRSGEMKKSDSQKTEKTLQSVRFADEEKSRVSEDSFAKWKKSVKTAFSETTGDSDAKEDEGARDGGTSAVLGAFRGFSESTGLTGASGVSSNDQALHVSTSDNDPSSHDPMLAAFLDSAVNIASLSSTSTGFASNAAGSGVGPHVFINALTQEKKDSGTTRSSSHPMSSIFHSSGTTDYTTPSSLAQAQTASGSGSTGPPSSNAVAAASGSGTSGPPSSDDAVAGSPPNSSGTTGSTGNNNQTSSGTDSGPPSSDAVVEEASSDTLDTFVDDPQFDSTSSRKDDNKQNTRERFDSAFDTSNVPPQFFDPLESSKKRLNARQSVTSSRVPRPAARTRSTSATSTSMQAPSFSEDYDNITPLQHDRQESRRGSSAHQRRHSDSIISAASGSGGDTGINSLFASVKKSFAKGKVITSKSRRGPSNIPRGPSQEELLVRGSATYDKGRIKV